MFGITEGYEKWMNKPIFDCPLADRHDYLQLVHMKCFAVSIMNGCVMNILVVKKIQNYFMSILGICVLAFLLSPHLIWKIIPVVFLIAAFFIPYLRGNLNFRYGMFYLYCLICCMEIQGFEFLFDLYLIICFFGETLYSYYVKKHLHVLSTTLCELGIWTLPCSTTFRIGITFAYLVVEAYNYPQVWAISTFYVTMAGYMFISHMRGFELEEQLELVKNSATFLFEFFITNASLSITPERKKYHKSS